MSVIKILNNIKVEGVLSKFTDSDYKRYSVDVFDDFSSPLIYKSSVYELVVAPEGNDTEIIISTDDSPFEYYKVFKTKEAAVEYAMSIIDELDFSDNLMDTLLYLDFIVR